MHADRARGERRQTYRLKGRNAYVGAGETFKAHTAMISGVPPSLADLSSSLNLDYDPIPSLGSSSDVDRYAAVRALAHRHDLGARRTTVLENVIDGKGDDRVVLEAAGVAAMTSSALLTTRTTMSLYMPSLASIAIRRLPPSSAWWATLLLAETVGGLRLQQLSLPSVLTR